MTFLLGISTEEIPDWMGLGRADFSLQGTAVPLKIGNWMIIPKAPDYLQQSLVGQAPRPARDPLVAPLPEATK